MEFVFEFNGHPPSVNNANPTMMRRGRPIRVKSQELRMWETMVAAVVRTHKDRNGFEGFTDYAYTLQIDVFQESWIQKNLLAVKKPDASNLIKHAEDAVCAVTGWKDQNALSVTINKVDAQGAPRTKMTFKFLTTIWPSKQ